MIKFFALVLLTVSAHASIEWKSIFISGDHSIPNFDNGRKTISSMLAPLGAYEENQQHFSSVAKEVVGKVKPATAEAIQAGFKNLKIDRKTNGCLIFMTSHGAKDGGFYLSRSGVMPPAFLGQMVQTACGDAPTVILISACFSGQFIAPALTGKNRIILTAARNDRPSFGCSADTQYTYWDECLISNFPTSHTWKELHEGVKSCISEKEVRLGFQPSYPQAFFGEAVKDLAILNK